MPRSLADGHEKIAILLEEPVNPAAPTLDELNDGIDAACLILDSDWSFGATDSATFNDRAVCEDIDSNDYANGAYQFGMTVFRSFTALHASDPTGDALFQAVKLKGSTIWVYARLTSKLSRDPWAASDEIRLGAEVSTDTPQPIKGGYIKHRVPGQVRRAYPFIAATAG